MGKQTYFLQSDIKAGNFFFFLDVVPFYFAQLWCRWDASLCVPFYFTFVNGDNKFFY